MAILALEEEMVLMRRAAQKASGEDARAYEVKARVKEKRAATIREMLTQSDLFWAISVQRIKWAVALCFRRD